MNNGPVAVADPVSTCTICLEALNVPGKACHALECQHQFHVGCLLNWFGSSACGTSPHCPLCRAAYTVPAAHPRYEQQIMTPVLVESRARYIEQQHRKHPEIFLPTLGTQIKRLKQKRKELRQSRKALVAFERTDDFKRMYKEYNQLWKRMERTADSLEKLEDKVAAYPVGIMLYEIKKID